MTKLTNIILSSRQFFEVASYQVYRPESKKASGRYVVSRSGFVWPSLRWSDWLMYSALPSRLFVAVVSIASYWKRGKARIERAEEIGIVHSNWSNGYYHWLTESLPRSYQLHQQFPDATIALPTISYKKYVESLNSIGITQIAFFPDEKNLEVENPILSKCPRKFATTEPAILKEIVEKIKENLSIPQCNLPDLVVYVSRRKARGRKILNEDALLARLNGLAVVNVCLEDFTFRDQVALMSRTKVLVGMHGAGLTNLMFMPAGSSVIEILPRRNGIFDYNKMRNSFRHDACFLRLAAAFNVLHHGIICDHDALFFKKTHMANIQLSEIDLRRIVDFLSSSSRPNS
jgi:hypothetical protein